MIILGGFIIVAVAASQIARYFLIYRLPIITGLLITGILAGPYVFGLIPKSVNKDLQFINDIALAFIAFAASAELYLREMRSRLNSIKWMTASQLIVTFIVSGGAIYLLADFIPFMQDMAIPMRIGLSTLFGAIFVARSPASAIAIINEMRAKGPFVQTALGVTVLKDFFVIVLFSICLEISVALFEGDPFDLRFILVLLLEMGASILAGLGLGRILIRILALPSKAVYKTILILTSGYAVYLVHYWLDDFTYIQYGHEMSIEPLLVCIIGSFLVTNFSKFRSEFLQIIEETGSVVYVAFFVLAGASVSLDILSTMFGVTILLFFIRLLSLVLGGFAGGMLAGDPMKFNRIAWMPYVTQAGVGLGLATVVANTFPSWGNEFASIVISVIVINQIIGPPLFKWAIHMVGEGHIRASTPKFDGVRDAVIFGLETQSIALARQLMENGWLVKIVVINEDVNKEQYSDIDIHSVNEVSLEAFKPLEIEKSEAVVTMLTDDENYAICELVYEHIGTKDMIVRLNHRFNFNKFHKLGALIVDPSTAIVGLLDHFVRSPQAASLLLGMQSNQDSMDVEVLNPDLHSLRLRNLRLPSDVIVLSLKRRGNFIITHGYTRLRKGDVLTVVGSKNSLEKVALKFDKP